MPEDYQALVLATYKRKKDNEELSRRLLAPTIAKLKEECLRVYDERYTQQDNDILSMFFNVDKIGHDFRNIIRDANVGAFKALLNHLNDITSSTTERNSELLAWLIDFQPRPSIRYYKHVYRAPQKEEPIIKENESLGDLAEQIDIVDVTDIDIPTKENTATEEEERPGTENGEGGSMSAGIGKTTKPKASVISKLVGLGIALVLASGIAYWHLNGDTPNIDIFNPIMSTPNKKCMHWVDDHYEGIACGQASRTPVVPLNQTVLSRLQKINTPDTLTKYALGRVWYAKINGKHEFYTDSGMHPVDTAKRLKPITPYVLANYVSYYRYLLTLVLWAAGVFVLLVFAGAVLYRYVPKAFFAKPLAANG